MKRVWSSGQIQATIYRARLLGSSVSRAETKSWNRIRSRERTAIMDVEKREWFRVFGRRTVADHYIIAASYVPGGWRREVFNAEDMVREVQAGCDASPCGEVVVVHHLKIAASTVDQPRAADAVDPVDHSTDVGPRA